MAGQTNEGGERRRALDAERTGSGRRVPGHAAPAPAPFGAPDPFTTPASGTRAVWSAAPSAHSTPGPTTSTSTSSTATPPLGTPLPSRRDRAALRRPTALDEAAVRASAQASESAAWRTSPALEDPRTASAIARPSPLTHALARTLTEHLDSLTPPAGLAPAPSSAPPAPSVYVPRRRPAPAVSGPLPVVGTTTGVEAHREPSWTTQPVSSRRGQRPVAASPFDSAPFDAAPSVSAPFDAAPTGEAPVTRAPSWTAPRGDGELPPPPPAAEVEAAARALAARLSTAPVPPPMPDRVAAEPAGRTSFLVAGLPGPLSADPTGPDPLTTGLPAAAAPRFPGLTPARPGQPASGPTAALTAADLAALRSATSAAAGLTAAPAPADRTSAGTAAGPEAAETATSPADPRHGRATGRAAGRSTGRSAGRTGRGAGTTGRVGRSTQAAATSTAAAVPAAGSGTRPPGRAGSSRTPGSRPDGGRRWHQRRALGLPVGILAAAVALAAAVVVGTVSGAPGHEEITAALASASGAGAPGAATPAAATPTAGHSASAAAKTAGGASSAAAADQGVAAAPQTTGASPAASKAAAPASSAPASSARTTPLGDVTYEGFGTAKTTYVELGTKDSRDVRQDLGSTFTKTMTGSKDWPGWYVAVSNFDRAAGGTVGCRIKDADGTVLAEETSSTAGQPATCIVGAPAGIN